MTIEAFGSGDEKSRSLRLTGNVPDQYDRDIVFLCTGDGIDKMPRRFIRRPQGQFAPGEVVVLDVADDQDFSGRIYSTRLNRCFLRRNRHLLRQRS